MKYKREHSTTVQYSQSIHLIIYHHCPYLLLLLHLLPIKRLLGRHAIRIDRIRRPDQRHSGGLLLEHLRLLFFLSDGAEDESGRFPIHLRG